MVKLNKKSFGHVYDVCLFIQWHNLLPMLEVADQRLNTGFVLNFLLPTSLNNLQLTRGGSQYPEISFQTYFNLLILVQVSDWRLD